MGGPPPTVRLLGAWPGRPGPAGETIPGLVVRFPRIKRHARLAGVDEEGSRGWIERGGPEVGAAGDVGTGDRAFFVGCVPRQFDRPAVAADLFRPRRGYQRFGCHHLTVGAID